jgi:hypothetical protein
MIWSKRMFSKSCRHSTRSMRHGMHAMRPTGNSAFDSYKADTLARLEQEQADFEAFLERLREAKDKSEETLPALHRLHLWHDHPRR